MHPKTNLCFLNTTRFWGGGEKWHFETACFMAERGHHVLFIVHPQGELHRRLMDKGGIEVVPVSVSNVSFLNIFKLQKLIRLFRSEKIQTVVFNGSSDVKLGAPAAKLAGVPAIVYRRGLAVPVKNSPLNRFLYGRLVTHFLTNSEETTKELFRHLGLLCSPDRIKTIYNGIDLSSLETKTPDTSHIFRQDEKRTLILGTAGRLEAQKGHEYLLEVAKRLLDQKINFRLLIAGDGSRYHHISRLIEDSGLTGFVSLLGFVTDIDKFMRGIDIFVFPSLWEGFGYAAAEAMAAKLPLVAFDVSSNREIIEDGKTGFLVPEGDVDRFTEKVIQLAGNPALRAKMGQNGRDHVHDRFERTGQLRKIETYLCRTVFSESPNPTT
jgi:glycosyltransferase involved in cell wall biosynthesis